MAIFQNNILKQEELNGGFEPHSDGDESFLLNSMDSYPANLPDFSQTKRIIEEPVVEISEPMQEEIPLSDNDEQTSQDWISGLFNENSSEQGIPTVPSESDTQIDYSNVMPGANELPSGNELPVDNIIIDEHQEIGLVEDPKVAFIGDENVSDDFEQMLKKEMQRENDELESIPEIPMEEPSYSSNIFDEPAVNIDIPATDIIQDEPISNSIPSISIPNLEESPDHSLDQYDFTPVDGSDGAKEFDLSSVITAEHPSTMNLQNNTEVPQEPHEDNKAKKQKKVKEPKPEKEKKEHKAMGPLFKKIGFIAAIALIAIGFIGGLYYFGAFEAGKKFVTGLFSSDTTNVAEDIKKTESTKTESNKAKQKDVEPKTVNHSDTANQLVANSGVTNIDTVKPDDKQKDEIQKTEAGQNSQIVQKNQIEQKTKIETKNPDVSKTQKIPPAIDKQIVGNKKEIAKTKELKKTTVKQSKPVKQKSETKITDVADNKPRADKKVDVKADTKNNIKAKATKIEKKQSIDELYSIQLYASPSKEDANEWVQKLKKKKLGDVYISTQVIRDKVWYRVRCGYYKTKEEAKSAANNLGFSQSWIDRIK